MYFQITNLKFAEGNPFFGADKLWASFQKKVEEYTNSREGSATVKIPILERNDWELVKDVLLGNKPISELGYK